MKNLLSQETIELFDSLNTPEKIQKFIDDSIEYEPSKEDRTVNEVTQDLKAECYNGALFATTCLQYHGFNSSIIELLAREDEEHVLCIYKQNNRFGSIAQSKYLGLKGRTPIYMNIRDLVASYMEFYFGYDGHYALHSFTELFPLEKFDFKWINDTNVVIEIAKDIRSRHHFELVGKDDPYQYVNAERYWKEILIFPKGTVVPDFYLQNKPKN